jgi:hypothetical protein
MRKLSSLMVLTLLLCGLAIAQGYDRRSDRPQNERITNGPVVESTGHDWAIIAWSTNTGGSSIVRYGTHPDHLSQMAESPYVDDSRHRGTHRVKVQNLRPGTTYYFMVDSGQGQGTGTEARSGVGQFTTRR